MEKDIYLHHFGHYLAIFVEFTFAYGGWEAFKTSINKVSLRKNPFYEENKELLTQLKANAFVLTQDSNDRVTLKKTNAAKTLSDLEKNEAEAQLIYNGVKFQSMFYLMGAIYLTTLVLAGIQSEDLNKPIFVFLGLTSFLTYIYQVKSLRITHTEAKTSIWINDKWRNSFVALELYFLIGFFGFLLLFIVFFFVSSPAWCQVDFHLFSYHFCIKNIIKGSIVFAILGLPILPFYAFYRRDKYFLDYYETRFKDLESRLKELVDDINSENTSQNLILTLTDRLEGGRQA